MCAALPGGWSATPPPAAHAHYKKTDPPRHVLSNLDVLKASAPSLARIGRGNAQEWTTGDHLDRMAYRLSNVMVSSPFHKFFVIMLSTSLLIFIGGCLLRVVGSHSWMEALFKSFALLSAAPGADSVNEETFSNTVASNLLFLMVYGCIC